MSTLHISLQKMRNFSCLSVASESMIPLSLPFDSTVISRLIINKKWSSTCPYDLFALLHILGRQITLWNRLLLTLGHLLWGWRTLRMLGIVGGEGCKTILKDDLKYPSKQGTKQSSSGSTSPDEDGRCPRSVFLLTDSLLVNVSLFWHRYTYGKPVQGKVEITVATYSQAMEDNFASSAIQKQNSWVGEEIGERKVSCAGSVFLPP